MKKDNFALPVFEEKEVKSNKTPHKVRLFRASGSVIHAKLKKSRQEVLVDVTDKTNPGYVATLIKGSSWQWVSLKNLIMPKGYKPYMTKEERRAAA